MKLEKLRKELFILKKEISMDPKLMVVGVIGVLLVISIIKKVKRVIVICWTLYKRK